MRCGGLVTDVGSTSDLPFGTFRDRAVYVVDVANLEEDAQDLIFARVISKLRESLERRDLGVKHVVVFVDELNKYAPSDGQDTYVRKMLLDIAERGRYLGLVLFSAQQFRSQVHRRVVGNSGTGLFGRMDADELATPGYAVLSPATRTKLATLEKGQLMIRHPHFTQPIFARFPRPAVMTGRDGAERYPQAGELTIEASVTRALRQLDPAVSLAWVTETIGFHEEHEVLRARDRTVLTRPDDVRAFFASQLRKIVPARAATAPTAPTTAPIRTIPSDDPYGF
jgi:DNA helicase HerA-like ATPase